MPKNRVFKKRRNGFVNFVTRPVTIFAAFLAVVAVSYTHLDVYKRQGFGVSARMPK